MREETLSKIKQEFIKIKEDLIKTKEDNNEKLLDAINNIRINHCKEIEEDNNNIFVYFKSYHVSKVVPDDIINVPYGSEKEDFRRYVNLETGEGIDVFKTYFEEYEQNDNVVIPDNSIYTYNDFCRLRSSFILNAINEGQDKAVQKVLK